MVYRYAVLLLALTLAAHGQTQVDLKTQSKDIDFSTATTTKPFKSGTVFPSVCGVGEAFFKTDASPGANLYSCTSVNTWTLETGAISRVQNAGTNLPVEPTLNFASGGCSDDSLNSRTNCTGGGGGATLNGLTGAVVISGGANNSCTVAGQTITCDVATTSILSRTADQSGIDHYLGASGTACPGGACAYTACPNPALIAYTPGMEFILTPDVASGAGLNTLNVCTLGPIVLRKLSGSSLVNIGANDIVAGNPGPEYKLIAAGSPVTAFVVVPMNFSPNSPTVTSPGYFTNNISGFQNFHGTAFASGGHYAQWVYLDSPKTLTTLRIYTATALAATKGIRAAVWDNGCTTILAKSTVVTFTAAGASASFNFTTTVIPAGGHFVSFVTDDPTLDVLLAAQSGTLLSAMVSSQAYGFAANGPVGSGASIDFPAACGALNPTLNDIISFTLIP